jgi:hypothetical protein
VACGSLRRIGFHKIAIDGEMLARAAIQLMAKPGSASCQAHHVSIGAAEDRCRSKGEVGRRYGERTA